MIDVAVNDAVLFDLERYFNEFNFCSKLKMKVLSSFVRRVKLHQLNLQFPTSRKLTRAIYRDELKANQIRLQDSFSKNLIIAICCETNEAITIWVTVSWFPKFYVRYLWTRWRASKIIVICIQFYASRKLGRNLYAMLTLKITFLTMSMSILSRLTPVFRQVGAYGESKFQISRFVHNLSLSNLKEMEYKVVERGSPYSQDYRVYICKW